MFTLTSCWADFQDQERHLYAGGFPTADVLHPHEWILAGPIGGFVGYGWSSRWSMVWDYPAAFSGILGLMTRYQIKDDDSDTSYAVEGYLTYFPNLYTDERRDQYRVDHQGGQGWLHFIRTQRLGERVRFHAYAGFTDSNLQRYRDYKDDAFPDTLYRHHWNPDAGLGLEYRATSWMELHVSGLYGNTFLYDDLTALKSMVIAGALFAPFSNRRWAILRNLRLEFNISYLDVPDAHYHRVPPISLLPYLYWQWGGN